jgi:hypothetical protein
MMRIFFAIRYIAPGVFLELRGGCRRRRTACEAILVDYAVRLWNGWQ